MTPMKVGIMLPVGDTDGPTGGLPGWADVRDLAMHAEAVGLDSVWLADHFHYRDDAGLVHGMHEAWSLLAAVAAVTERVEVGPLVLCSSFRSPGLVAKMAATTDLVAGGRLVLGLGAGWHRPEYEAFGYPFDHRVSRFSEALEIVVRLLDGATVTLDGRFHQVREATLAPTPIRRVPVLVAADGPRMLTLTARWADAWNTAWYGPVTDELRSAVSALDAALAAAGRDPRSLLKTVGLTVRDPAQPPIAEPEPEALEGTPDGIARALDAHEALGFGHAIVGLEPMTRRSVDRLAEALSLHRGGQSGASFG